jgi:hypothetical protein
LALTLFRDEAGVFGNADNTFLAQVVQDRFGGFFPSCNFSPDIQCIPVSPLVVHLFLPL